MAVSDDVEQALAAVNPAPTTKNIANDTVMSLVTMYAALDILGAILTPPDEVVEDSLLQQSLYWASGSGGPFKIVVTDKTISITSTTVSVVVTYDIGPPIQALKPIFKSYFPTLCKDRIVAVSTQPEAIDPPEGDVE